MLRNHMKRDHGENDAATLHLRLHELEKQILEQKLDLAIKISKLKETEETCICTGWCAINHRKNSWK